MTQILLSVVGSAGIVLTVYLLFLRLSRQLQAVQSRVTALDEMVRDHHSVVRRFDEASGEMLAVQFEILNLNRRNLPELRPSPILDETPFEEFFFGNSSEVMAGVSETNGQEEFITTGQPDWVESVAEKLTVLPGFSSQSEEWRSQAMAGAKVLLKLGEGLAWFALENKEVIAEYLLESLLTGGVPVTTVAVALINAPIRRPLNGMKAQMTLLNDSSHRARWANLKSLYASARRIANSPIPENRAFVLDLLRQLDDHKAFFKDQVREETAKITAPGFITRYFNRKRGESAHIEEFDKFCGDFLVYKRLLGLELVLVHLLNDPHIERSHVRSLREENLSLQKMLTEIQEQWTSGCASNGSQPEPKLLGEIRGLSHDTSSVLASLEIAIPAIQANEQSEISKVNPTFLRGR